MQQKLFKIFLTQETGASGNNIEKEPQKSRPILRKKILNLYRENLLWLQSNASGISCKHILIL